MPRNISELKSIIRNQRPKEHFRYPFGFGCRKCGDKHTDVIPLGISFRTIINNDDLQGDFFKAIRALPTRTEALLMTDNVYTKCYSCGFLKTQNMSTFKDRLKFWIKRSPHVKSWEK